MDRKAAPADSSARFIVVEFHGDGDPFFGGTAADRPLGKEGKFLAGSYAPSAVAEFSSREEALASAERASNRRPLGQLSSWERA